MNANDNSNGMAQQSLTLETLDAFTALLASNAPAPGGGSAAALCGAMGASLCSMVANLTLGRKKYEALQEFALQTVSRTESLRLDFLKAVDLDSDVFGRLSGVLSMPKDTEAQKLARFEAIQQSLYECVESPLLVMRLSKEAIELTESLIGQSNSSAASDIGVSALCLKAAVQSAWLNVKINLTSMKNEEKRNSYREEGEALLEAVCLHADNCYNAILHSL